jgi:protein-tyrosine phosphatase
MSSLRILMVCLGNICRSPLAEGILREKTRAAGLDWEIDSAGTNGYHIGEPPHPLSQKVARQHGIDIGYQRARKFSPADFQRFDKIYAMADDVIDDMRRIAGKSWNASKVGLLMNEVRPGSDEDVPDPWYGPEPGYHQVYDLIDSAADKIISHYGKPESQNAARPNNAASPNNVAPPNNPSHPNKPAPPNIAARPNPSPKA